MFLRLTFGAGDAKAPGVANSGPFFLARTSTLRLEPSQARSYVRQRPAGGAPSIVNLTVAAALSVAFAAATINHSNKRADQRIPRQHQMGSAPKYVTKPGLSTFSTRSSPMRLASLSTSSIQRCWQRRHASGRGNNSDFRGVAVVAMMSRRQARSLMRQTACARRVPPAMTGGGTWEGATCSA